MSSSSINQINIIRGMKKLKEKYDTYDDKQLVAALLKNEESAILYFFNVKCSGLLAYIIENVFDRKVDRRDLVQELFLYLAENDWYKLRRFDYRSKLTTWVSVVAVRFFQKKRLYLIEKESSQTLNSQEGNQIEYNFSEEIRKDLLSAIQRMPNARYRNVIESLYLKETRPEELAKEMNITIENLYNIRHRAMLQLKTVIGRKEEYYD